MIISMHLFYYSPLFQKIINTFHISINTHPLITPHYNPQNMPRKRSDSSSSSSESPPRRKQRLNKHPHLDSDSEKIERTDRKRTRDKLKYDHQPDQLQTKPKQIKQEPTLDKKYLVDAKLEKEEPKSIHKQEPKFNYLKDGELKEEIIIKNEKVKKEQRAGEIPLIITKNNTTKNQRHLKILDEADQDAQALVQLMVKAHEFDKKLIKKGKIACQRIRILEIIREKTKNLVVKRKFIEKGGLQQMCLWMLPMKNKEGKTMQPCIAVKMGLLRILHDMGLDSLQIKDYGSSLWQILRNNKRETKIPQLKNICSQILTLWDYTAFSRFSSKIYAQ